MNEPQPAAEDAAHEGEPHGAVRVNAPTEGSNPATADIDLLDSLQVLRRINAEDHTVAEAVGRALPELARAVDAAVETLRSGGRVHYVGAGTSGRLAMADAAELVPTYDVPPDWFTAHQAGGEDAFRQPVENAEDDSAAGARAVETGAGRGDFVLGLTASGRTPFVLAALDAARRIGAGTALLCADPAAAERAHVDVAITVDTGPEPITGSTRMKAGTAQKMVLTSFSTAVMVRMGRTYSNLMVGLVATNAKLRGRTIGILREATGASERTCERALAEAGGELKVALVHLLAGVGVERASAALTSANGHVREALRSLDG